MTPVTPSAPSIGTPSHDWVSSPWAWGMVIAPDVSISSAVAKRSGFPVRITVEVRPAPNGMGSIA